MTTKPAAKPKPAAAAAATTDPPKRRLTLADLSDEERVSLLSEAREAAKRNPTDVEGYAELSDREKLIRSAMDARDHFRGCPVQEGTTLGRIEGYDGRKPPTQREDAKQVAVIRCVECGGTTVYAIPLEQALERAAAGDDVGDDTP